MGCYFGLFNCSPGSLNEPVFSFSAAGPKAAGLFVFCCEGGAFLPASSPPGANCLFPFCPG